MKRSKGKKPTRSRFALRENQARAEQAEAETERVKAAFASVVVTQTLLLDALSKQVLGT